MEITEVRIKLIAGKNDKLRAFCSITIDNDFVIRDLKVIEGTRGPFVAMPSRKLMERCRSCKGKNHSRAKFCNECGKRLPARNGRGDRAVKFHADIAHPINSGCREFLQRRVLDFYAEELERARQPGYRPDDLEVFDEEGLVEEAATFGEPGGETTAGDTVAGEPVEAEAMEADGGRRTAYDRMPERFEDESLGQRYRPRGGEPAGRNLELGRDIEPVSREDATYPLLAREPAAERESFGRRKVHKEVESEPEDNFGAGLFS